MDTTSILLSAAVIAAAIVMVFVTAWTILRPRYRLPTPCDETTRVRTADGWDLAVYRYKPRRPAHGREPVILCHGMLSNRFNVDLDEQASLARYLREEGFDAWVMELRGHGGSRRVGRGRPFDWNLDDYIVTDLTSVVEHVRCATGSSQVHWFGHSMGGMLLYGACALNGLSQKIRSAALSDAPASFAPLRTSTRIARLYGKVFPAVPPGLVLPFLGPLAWVVPGILGPRYGLRNRRLIMQLLANAVISWGSSRALLQFCDMIESGRFRSADGVTDYEAGAARVEFPLLVLSAEKKMMSEEAIVAGFESAPTRAKKYIRCSRQNGYSIDYTHSNLLVSPSSRQEIFPEIARWFREHSSG